MANFELIHLLRDVEAIEVPSGQPLQLEKGMQIRIMQSLGGSYTITTDWGGMARISDRDADALGKESSPPPGTAPGDADKSTSDLVWDQLRTCYDPEIPVNIVDLGLIYACEVKPGAEEGSSKVDVTMTLTAPGCGMGDVLRADVLRKVLSVPTIKEADVQLVIDPPWDQSLMSEAARLQLGLL